MARKTSFSSTIDYSEYRYVRRAIHENSLGKRPRTLSYSNLDNNRNQHGRRITNRNWSANPPTSASLHHNVLSQSGQRHGFRCKTED